MIQCLVEITNPNPRPVEILLDSRVLCTLGTHDSRMLQPHETLALRCPTGLAKVVCREYWVDDGYSDGWIVEVRSAAVPITLPSRAE